MMKQQDIVWIRFPFSTLTKHKIRPALIVSNNQYNAKSSDVIVCAVTSKLDHTNGIIIDSDDLVEGSLPLKSMIRADKIMQVNKVLIERSFARLHDMQFDKLSNHIYDLVRRKA